MAVMILQALEQLNWLCATGASINPIQMDLLPVHIVWQVYREVGSREPSMSLRPTARPAPTRARRHSRAVSEFSQHMARQGHGFLPRRTIGGPNPRDRHAGAARRVGYYPNARYPFVHLDTGSVRAWPRMTRDQLVRLFPKGRPSTSRPTASRCPATRRRRPGVLARGGTVAGYTAYASAEESNTRAAAQPVGTLFGGGDDEDTEYYRQDADPPPSPAPRLTTARMAACAGLLFQAGAAAATTPSAAGAAPRQAGLTAPQAQSPPPGACAFCLRAGQAIWRFLLMRRCRPPARLRSRALALFRFQVRFWIRISH